MVKYINLKKSYGKSKDKALTPDERDKLKNYIKNARDRALFFVMTYGGLRVGEVEQLRFEWLKKKVNEKNKKTYLTIHIPEKTKDIRNKKKIWQPKTKRERYVYIFDPEVYNEIYIYLQMNEDWFNISQRQIRNIVYKWGKLINKKISPHGLRATAQNYLKYELGLRIEVISYILGHKCVDTTQKYYDTRDKAQVEFYLMNTIYNENNNNQNGNI